MSVRVVPPQVCRIEGSPSAGRRLVLSRVQKKAWYEHEGGLKASLKVHYIHGTGALWLLGYSAAAYLNSLPFAALAKVQVYLAT